ncbi:flagellar hook protein FlgE [Texcoconibacillus texcoconensis]|uniref:Flagellar hook protein FlgE n=1 Tax=Texcoconibacillus texcoconensis TaxID=1095777 RepID=A0A840QL35_9BACI|nr:flagellar hook protein FlgE [Texcoconibacillus texcoconensis]MBB5172071.1 flagellar hook protein FlgE [Texcoconibacillus texcoconensis]
MLRAMYSGIGGMNNFQDKLDVIGNNVSNANTHGFKKDRTTFQDLVSQQLAGASTPQDDRGGTNPQQIGLGTTMASTDTIHNQGSMQTTGRDLDMAISGDGFFVVNDGEQGLYTRAGNFYLDEEGTLVNSQGLRVQGYGADEGGNIEIDDDNLGDLTIQAGDARNPVPTSNFDFAGNLSTETEAEESITVPYSVTDSQGEEHELEITFTRATDDDDDEITSNEWNFEISSLGNSQLNGNSYNADDDQSVEDLDDEEDDDFSISGTLNFNPDGTLDEIDDVESGQVEFDDDDDNYDALFLDPNNGAEVIEVPIDEEMFASVTQNASSTTVDLNSVDGSQQSTLESYSVSEAGEITGVYANGTTQLLGQIAIANFNNPGGLSKSGENTYEISNNSGGAQIGAPGTEGRGSLTGAALEMSNVDLSEELSEMIVAQRGFQSNSRMISASDEILQELVNLGR